VLPVIPAAAPPPDLHLWGPPDLLAALAGRLGRAADPRLRLQGDPLGGLLSDLMAGGAGGAADLPGLRLPPGVTGLVLYPGLAEVLALVLPGSGDAARGVAVWTALAEALLAAWARQRRQMLLLPAADLAADLAPDPEAGPAGPLPDGPLALLADRTGLRADPGDDAAPVPEPPPPEARLAAAVLLQTLAPLRALHDRLAAASLPRQGADLPDPATPEALCAALDAGRRALQARDRMHGLELRRHEMAAEAAAQQARRQIDAAEAAVLAEAGRLAAILDEIEADRAAALRAQAEAKAAREAEVAQQSTAQEVALARLAAGLAAAEGLAAARLDEAGQLARDIALRDDRIRRLAEALQQAEADLGHLRASHSWRVTAPLRALSRAARSLRP
jgi:hypothetical protein